MKWSASKNLYNGSNFLLKGLNISFFIEIPSQPKHSNPSLRRNDDVVKVKCVCPEAVTSENLFFDKIIVIGRRDRVVERLDR